MKENRSTTLKTMGQIRIFTCLCALGLTLFTLSTVAGIALWFRGSSEQLLPSLSSLSAAEKSVQVEDNDDGYSESSDREVSTVNSIRGAVTAASSTVASTSSSVSKSISSFSASSTPKVTVVDLPEKDYGLGHMWNCSKNDFVGKDLAPQDQRKKKLIFVHVFKTAGSTFRTLFRQYSSRCHAGLSVVVHCSGWVGSQPSANGELIWQGKHKRSGFQSPCELKEHDFRKPQEGQRAPYVVTDKFIQKETDMIAGHMSMGVHRGFINKESKVNPEYQYITFFRDAVSRYVSAFVYVKAKRGVEYTAEEAIRRMKKDVRNKVDQGEYCEGYSPYLLLPEQRTKLLTVESRVRQIQQNMVDFNVMIGVVEKMDTSLDMLSHLIDKDRDARTLLDALDPRIPKEKSMTKNQSHLSTSTLVKMLKEDKSFVPVLEKYLKYDAAIYEFAVKMHERQVKATLGSQAIASTTA